jgi:DNA polymerase I-like protein with 3'-5' exonuclease and polymerase domains
MTAAPLFDDDVPRTAREAALWLLARGWAPLPLPYRSKSTTRPNWPELRLNAAEVPRAFPEPSNIGVILGEASGGLVDVDLDTPQARAAAPFLLPGTDLISGRASAPDSHRWYVVADPPAKASEAFLDPLGGTRTKLLELRSTGGQTVLPPSVYPADPEKGHPEPEPCVWHRHGEPVRVDLGELRSAVAAVAAAALLGRCWPGGARHDAALALAGGLLRAGWAVERVEQFVRAVCAAAGDREVNDRLTAVRDTAAQLAEGKTATGWPTLEHLLRSAGPDVVGAVRDWLGCRPTPTPNVRSSESSGAGRGGTPRYTPIPPYRPFPTDCLPTPWDTFVREGAAALKCDEALVTLPLLAVLAAAIGNTRRVHLGAEWFEPAVMWTCVVAESGGRKSPAAELGVERVKLRQKRLVKEHKDALKEHKKQAAEHKARKREDGEDGAGDEPAKPKLGRVLVGDITIEKLAGLLDDNRRGLLVYRDELAGWVGSFTRYKGKGGGSDEPNWLSIHRGDALIYDRKTGDKTSVFVPHACASVCGGVQPGVLKRLASHDLFDSGLVARLIFAMPPRTPKTWSDDRISDATKEAADRSLAALYGLSAEVDEDDDPRPVVVGLTAEARERLKGFVNAWGLRQFEAEGERAAALAKLEALPGRFALIHHTVLRAEALEDTDPIGADSMEAGIQLAEWCANETERVYAIIHESAGDKEVRKLVELVTRLAAKDGGRLTVKALQNANSRKYKSSDEAKADLDRLVELELGRWEPGPAPARGGKAVTYFVPVVPGSEAGSRSCTTHDDSDDRPSTDPVPGSEAGEDSSDDRPEPPDDPSAPVPPSPAGSADPACSCGDTAGERVPRSSESSCVVQERVTEPGGAINRPTVPGGSRTPSGPVVGTRLVTDDAGSGAVIEAVQSGPRSGLDLETTGLSHARDRVRLLSLATPAGTFLVDVFRVDPAPLWPALAATEVVGHNLGFDLPFLMKLGFVPGRVRDTMLASQVLHAGDRSVSHALKDVAQQRLGITLDKELQTADWSGPLSEAHLGYAARDAEVPVALWEKLSAETASANLTGTVETEMAALPAVAWAALHGVGFDRAAWVAVAAEAEARAAVLRERLDELVPNAGNLFGVTNWNSPDAVAEAFAGLGVKLDSTDDDALAALDHPAAGLLREYRAAAKLSSAYGREWLRHVAPDGRVYATWKQIGAGASGRMSCKEPNLQQLPRDPRYRKCFVAPPGRVLVKADYSQIELRIAAKITGDKRMLDAYRRGEDLHTTTARAVLGKEQPTKADRQIAKSCFSGDTEILTPGGWVRFDRYDGRAPVAQYALPPGLIYNPPRGRGNRWGRSTGKVSWDGTGGAVEFVRPLAFCSFVDREVWHQRDRSTDLLVTDDHEIVYLDKARRPRKQPLGAIAPGNVRYLVAAGILARQPTLSEPLTRVLAMVVADGSFRGGPAVRLGFSKPRKIERCRQLLRAAGIAFRERTGAAGGGAAVGVTTFVIDDRAVRERLLRYSSDRKDLSWSCLTDLDGAVYLDEASYWDSHRIPAASRVRALFSTTRKQTADVMQALACTSGIGSVLRFSQRSESHHNDLWDLSYPLGAAPRWRASWNPQPVMERMTVYCVQVTSGALLVRRNGRVVVAGNCNFGLLYGMGSKSLAAYAASNFGVALSEAEAAKHRDAFFRTYPGLRAWHRAVPSGTIQTRTLAGRRRIGVSAFTEKLNTPTQGSGADGLKRALALLWERRGTCPGAFPVLLVHDEIVVECDDAQKEAVAVWVRDAMRDGMAPLLDPVPVEVEVSAGRTWGG